ncbi:S9 family peptidase [Humibacter albus]|uniref:S9 family peptidase n=1 Tax=Humibacter albus TaxID=427754 RepID=UPI0003B640C4|nr:S9 family peptidase [Humibacter albus]
MKPADITRLVSVSRPTLSPDGVTAVFATSRPDLGADAYVGQLWSVEVTRDGTPRRLTRGFRDSAPQFSPDGSAIAFLRAEPGKPAQLHIMAATGGEPVRLTDRTLGVTEFAWAPDGSKVAFVSRDPEQGRYGTVEGVDASAEPPRRFTTYRYSANGLGWMRDRRSQVYLVDVPAPGAEPVVQPAASSSGPAEPLPATPEARQLTSDDAEHGAIEFSPDGRLIAVVSDGHLGSDEDLREILTLVPVDGGERTIAVAPERNLSLSSSGSVAFGHDGAIYFIAQEVGESGRDFVARNSGLFRIDAPGEEPRRLTDAESIDLTGSTVVLTASGALVQNTTRGRVTLLSVTDDGEATVLVADREVTGTAAAGDRVVIAFQSPTSFGDIGVVDASSTAEGSDAPAEAGAEAVHVLTDFSAEIGECSIRVPVELETAGRDGYPVHGWVVLPEGEGPHPVLLNIHGGPFAQYSVHLFDESQVYANAGYAVVYCNPRGSAGYGQEHGRAIKGRMGTVDLNDVLDFLDAAIAAHPQLDAHRLGILGGSYGGYLTAWTIAHDHRFAGAIVERGFLDPEYFFGTSDIGSFFGEEYNGTDPQLIAAQSPQAHVNDVRTPTLVMHSEQDLRCPLGQAERYYASLKRAGVETELVVFPGEDHELSRAGRPRHRVQRFEIILDWWARHLPSERNAASA